MITLSLSKGASGVHKPAYVYVASTGGFSSVRDVGVRARGCVRQRGVCLQLLWVCRATLSTSLNLCFLMTHVHNCAVEHETCYSSA